MLFFAEVVELVDTHVSGACVRKDMGVRVPPSAQKKDVDVETRLIASLHQRLFSFKHAPEEALFESPEEFKLPEDKSIKEKKRIIDRQDENPVEDRKPRGMAFM